MKGLLVLILSLSLWHWPWRKKGLAIHTASNRTTAWHDGGFRLNVADVIGRPDIVLGRANVDVGEALPLGNGAGVALWAAAGLTAQLNRANTLPERLSPGQVAIPGLVAMTEAKDFDGRLDLYNGEVREHGGGCMSRSTCSPARIPTMSF